MRPTDLIALAHEIVFSTDPSQRKTVFAKCPDEYKALLTANIGMMRRQAMFAKAKAHAKKIVEQRRGMQQYEARQVKSKLYNKGQTIGSSSPKLSNPHKPNAPRSLPFQSSRLTNVQKVRELIQGTRP